ncbi:uncharacterized protein LOC131023551 [Salvia miltiorrhiza]|uniref:uncharacterized protein LOC131023551 n=1 Tax=Salvia miltiorrhiza TaxID=226208 RepID=UPI0025AD8134|nr:uncharacterized protein LOC131023551 [Salvia miltiorrhiza]
MSRWKVNKKGKAMPGVPSKVLWYFPPIPRFRRMFRTREIAKELVWHADERKRDGKLRHPADAPAWRLVDNKWPDFGNEPRNLRLALATDGMNPHNMMNSNYSCWPVVLVTYNLPPWLCMKRRFMMLTLLISGPKQPGNDIDVYLAPLIDDLKELWEIGIQAYDAHRSQSFTLRSVLLWTINDFPAYGNLSGCSVKGYKACPICADQTHSKWLPYSRKVSYTGHRQFLPESHPYRRQKKAFDGVQELRAAPKPLSGTEVFERMQACNCVWGKTKGRKISDEVNSKKRKKKDKKEQNETKESVGPSVGNSCFKKKSIFYELEYWQYLHVRHILDVMHIEKNVLESLIGTLLDIPGKTKDGVAARMDLQLLPIAIRGVLPKHVRIAITRLCHFFNDICNKEIDVPRLEVIQKDIVTTLCLLEKYFTPSFFDIMGYVRNRHRPEGCIAESYIVEEAVEYCSEYLANTYTIGIPSSNLKDNLTESSSRATVKVISDEEWEQAHRYVLTNDADIDPYIEAHMAHLTTMFPKKAKIKKWLQEEHNRLFITWMREQVANTAIDSRLRFLSFGPSKRVTQYASYTIDGFVFNTKNRDDFRVAQNSGVSIHASVMQVASSKDKNPIVCDMLFYGRIEEIWELDYTAFRVVVFKCSWVDNKSGVRVDDSGFTLVNLNKLGYKTDSFILGNQAKQVFYIQDPEDEAWSVVLASPNKRYTEEVNRDNMGDISVQLQGFSSTVPVVDSNNASDENEPPCVREDCDVIWVDNANM